MSAPAEGVIEEATPADSHRFGRFLKSAAVTAGVTVGLLAVLEGGADIIHVYRRHYHAPGLPAHVRFDPELGWTGRPGYRHVPQGAPLTIDDRGFRSTGLPAQRGVGVVCLGDDLTFGTGVGDQQSWPSLLAQAGRGMATLNLGQEGYDLGQSYASYLRHEKEIDHRIVILGVTVDSVEGIRRDVWAGHPMPVVARDAGALRSVNTPLPRRGALFAWFTSLHEPLANLRLMAFLREKNILRALVGADDPLVIDPDEGQLAVAIIEDLHRRCQASGRMLLVVYLPESIDLAFARGRQLRSILHRELGARRIWFVDAANTFKVADSMGREALFSKERNAAYTPAGHALLARVLVGSLFQSR